MTTQRFGERQVTGTEYDDGKSRQFVQDPTDARQLLAQTLASRDGWREIRPAHWATAGALVRELKDAGHLRTAGERRMARERRAAAVTR